jgi:hypothetical protein
MIEQIVSDPSRIKAGLANRSGKKKKPAGDLPVCE